MDQQPCNLTAVECAELEFEGAAGRPWGGGGGGGGEALLLLLLAASLAAVLVPRLSRWARELLHGRYEVRLACVCPGWPGQASAGTCSL